MRDRPIADPCLRPLARALIRAGCGCALFAAAMPLLAAGPATDLPPARLQLSPALGTATARAPAAAADRVIQGSPTALRMLPLEVTVNGAPSGSWVLMERGGTLYAPADAFEEWRVTLRPTAVPFEHQGQQWYPLSAVPGFDAQLDFANQSVDLKFQPQAFAATRLGQPSAERLPLTPPTLGIFANYDLSYTRSAQRDLGSTQDLSALLELGASNALGVFTSTYAARNITSTDPLAPRTLRRLETTFTRDLPDDNLTLRLGDSSTRSGSWGRSVYFGGVQLSRNFGFTPGFIAQPLPVVTGLSSAPSTVELYINDALRQTSQVPTGPFAIDNFPLLTGNGQARIVVRDVLGRETVLVQDFFSHAELLEEGLSDWSVEAGAVRRDLGTSNADYGQVFGSGLLRYGLTKNLTLETRGELGRETQGAGVGLVQALPFSMLGQLGVAVSRDNTFGRGQQWLAALQHSSLRHGFTLRSEGASRGYRQIGQEVNSLAYRRQISGSYTYSAERLGALGLGFARVASYDQGTLSTYSANYSIRVGERSSLSFNVVHVSGQPGGAASATSVGVSLLVPLEKQLTLSASASHRNGQSDGYVSANQGMSDVTGLSWRTLAGRRTGQSYAEGGLYYQGTQGMVTADVNASSGQQTVRLGAQGGLVAIDGEVFASRPIQDSFALVEVPGYANVGVGFQGSVLARTNKDGKALVPRLLPYQSNSIRLDPSELPISAELDSIEQQVVPGNRTGVIVKFPVRSGRGALVRIVFDDGEPAPAGAGIELIGDKQEFFVARRGEAFITGLQPANQLRLNWEGASCTFAVNLPPATTQDDIARVGPLTCSGVRR
ncbi:fimbria/pilus outer membrane usher protein [Polaromonas sp. YR568]|uniref:fimbria/pilus outer membrane usher protein n=1 Tax=Polaromonas sp. YR568 TaxID=1855301 RepID=UPI00398C0142